MPIWSRLARLSIQFRKGKFPPKTWTLLLTILDSRIPLYKHGHKKNRREKKYPKYPVSNSTQNELKNGLCEVRKNKKNCERQKTKCRFVSLTIFTKFIQFFRSLSANLYHTKSYQIRTGSAKKSCKETSGRSENTSDSSHTQGAAD